MSGFINISTTSALANVNWTFIDEHRSSSLIVKSSRDTRGIRDRTYGHFSASLSTDRLESRSEMSSSWGEGAKATKNTVFYRVAQKIPTKRGCSHYLLSRRNLWSSNSKETACSFSVTLIFVLIYTMPRVFNFFIKL